MYTNISTVTVLLSILSLSATAESTGYHEGASVLRHVNPLIGTSDRSSEDGGMIPSVAPPFGMTRWTPQTRENFISSVPYSDRDRRIHGFQATHQPAIWMGELGQMVLMPGLSGKGDDGVNIAFQERGLAFNKTDENSTPYIYETLLNADSVGEFDWELTEEAAGSGPVPGGSQPGTPPPNWQVRKRDVEGKLPGLDARHPMAKVSKAPGCDSPQYVNTIRAAMTATSHVGYLRFDFEGDKRQKDIAQHQPYVILQASRPHWHGTIQIDPETREVSGSNSQRQDYALGPDHAKSFRGYFVSRFSAKFSSYGTAYGEVIQKGQSDARGENVSAYITFDKSVDRVEVRTGVSFVSIEQARRNLEVEIPDGESFESTVQSTKDAWLEKLGRVRISGINKTDAEHDPLTVFYTGLFHALQYPSDFSEPTSSVDGTNRTFYSGYTDSVQESNDSYYQSWSLWDTYRAEQSLLTLFAPERVDSMMRSLLRIFDWSGRLPMWANMVETNIMIATNADVVIANALVRGFQDFDISKAWKAVYKDAYEAPERDTELRYYDREPNTPYEVRAGLTSYLEQGWVDNDRWAEAASRTLDYAFDDYAAAVVASHAGDNATAQELYARSRNYAKIWNNATQFMQARNANGAFANENSGWTEGDKWVYTFDVMHDVGGLASLFANGKVGMLEKLDKHFSDGHNDHTNEPSHHVPYLYAALGFPADTAEKVRQIAWSNYNATASGLSGNEDLGQMSAWYVMSALGFYPVNPASDEYVVGTPFFDEVEIQLPAMPWAENQDEHKLVISAPGAGSRDKAYIKGLKVDGTSIDRPLLKHADIINAKHISFEMSSIPTSWGRDGDVTQTV